MKPVLYIANMDETGMGISIPFYNSYSRAVGGEDNSDKELAWFFEFGLESGNGKMLDRKYTEDLLDTIIQWAEEKDLQIGGGFRSPEENEI